MNINNMKHLLAILILTLGLAVHSYVLDGRLSARDDGDEDNGDGCEPILGFFTSYPNTGCQNDATSTSAIILDEQDACGGGDVIVIGQCHTFSTTTALSFQLNRARDSISCNLYTGGNVLTSVTAGECVSVSTPTAITAILCVENGDYISGSCGIACDTGYTNCNGKCVNEQTDANNCGSCGNVCSSGTCSNGVCMSSGFSARACISDNSIGNNIEPLLITMFGYQVFSPFQCYENCVQRAATFFTLAVDTNTAGDVNTICSCFVGSLVGTGTDLTTCTANGYGVTSDGTGSWQLYSIP